MKASVLGWLKPMVWPTIMALTGVLLAKALYSLNMPENIAWVAFWAVSFAVILGVAQWRMNILAKRLKIMEHQLERNEKLIKRTTTKATYFEKILDNSTDPIFTTDSENLVLKFNRGAETLFGYTQDEILGKPVQILFKDRTEIERLLDKVSIQGYAGSMDIRLVTIQGQAVHANLTVSSMHGEDLKVTGLVFNCQDISHRKKKEREMQSRTTQLEKLSRTDELTRLYNVRQFNHDMARLTALCADEPGRILSLLLIDMDHFKELNDTLGHKAGDEALQQLADAIRKNVRNASDAAYRYGGDEFVLLLLDADGEQAVTIGRRISETYAQLKSPENKTTLSIGIASYSAEMTPEIFFRHVDEAMYRSKKEGGGKIII
jgi:diguanylate cyclase (GGDEF)-like protein/PAS domain S-box-containing protein